MNTLCKQVLWKIIDCGLTYCPLNNFNNYPCNSLYQSQNCANDHDFQIPEPWNGDIWNAKILFVGINPGFTPNELYPQKSNPYWTKPALVGGVIFDKDKVEDFFENRFNQYYVKYWNTPQKKTRFSVRMNSGTYKNVHGFWNYLQNISTKLLGKATPGKDYALTELVHCKSGSIEHINPQCYYSCMDKHFKDILSLATNMEYLVIIGANTRKYVADFLKHGVPSKYVWLDTSINGNLVKTIYVDHNAGGGSVLKIPNV
jgi:hypothetical protein